MIIAGLQVPMLIYKSQSYFYIPVMNKWKLKFTHSIVYINTIKNEIFRYKSNKVCIEFI